jgi:hypothetical protein
MLIGGGRRMVSNTITQGGIDAELQHGESVLWVGKPLPSRIALQNRQALVTGVLALAALFVLFSGFSAAAIFSFFIFGCGFTWLGLLFLLLPFYYFARPVYDYLMAERTIYAVTDRRALIIKPKFGGRIIQSYNRIQNIERRELSGGKGDLIFASETQPTRSRARSRKVGFFGIPNAREVEQLMLGVLTGARDQFI